MAWTRLDCSSLEIWDALVLNIASEASCGLLLSEDLQNGFTCRNIVVVNPFLEKPHPMLASILQDFPGMP